MTVKLGRDLVSMDQKRRRASEVKIVEPIWTHDDMKWIISFGD